MTALVFCFTTLYLTTPFVCSCADVLAHCGGLLGVGSRGASKQQSCVRWLLDGTTGTFWPSDLEKILVTFSNAPAGSAITDSGPRTAQLVHVLPMTFESVVTSGKVLHRRTGFLAQHCYILKSCFWKIHCGFLFLFFLNSWKPARSPDAFLSIPNNFYKLLACKLKFPFCIFWVKFNFDFTQAALVGEISNQGLESVVSAQTLSTDNWRRSKLCALSFP